MMGNTTSSSHLNPVPAICNVQKDNEVEIIIDRVKDLIDSSDIFSSEAEKHDGMHKVVEFLYRKDDEYTRECKEHVFKLPPFFRMLKSFLSFKSDIYLKSCIRSIYDKEVGKIQNYQEEDQQNLGELDVTIPLPPPPSSTPPNADPPPDNPQFKTFTGVEVADFAKNKSVGQTLQWGLRFLGHMPKGPFSLEGLSLLDEALQGLNVSAGSWSQFTVVVGSFLGMTVFNGLINLWSYFNGRSGLRCCKNILDDTLSLASGVGAGAAAVALAGLAFGPLGFLLSLAISAVTGVITTWAANKYISKWTYSLFDLPKSEALEKCYNLLGVSEHATDAEINAACRRLCAPFHPDSVARRNPTEEEVQKAVEKFREFQDAKNFICTMRDLQKAGADDCDDSLDYKAKIIVFFKNLVSFMKRKKSDEVEEGRDAINCFGNLFEEVDENMASAEVDPQQKKWVQRWIEIWNEKVINMHPWFM